MDALKATVGFLIMSVLEIGHCSPINPCISDFCLAEPLDERTVVKKYGVGELRREKLPNTTHYRCYYLANHRAWAELTFDSHGGPPQLGGVMLSRTRLCATSSRPKIGMGAKLHQGEIQLGMSEKELRQILGPPSRTPVLRRHAQNPIFESKLGETALLYSAHRAPVFYVVYLRNSKVDGLGKYSAE